MKDEKNGRNISFEEEKIKSLLKSDVDCLANGAGNWSEISEEAYESHDCVKKSSVPLALAAACAAVIAVTMGFMQFFTDGYYELDTVPQAAIEDDVTSYGGEISQLDDSETDEELLETQGDYLFSESTPLMGEIEADYSIDENGNPLNGSYRLRFDVMFPHEDGYTDYGGLYVYAVCEGEILYSSVYPDYYQAGTVQTVTSVIFNMKEDTATENPTVTVIAAFVRDGSIKEIDGCTAVGSVSLKNPEYSADTADNAYANTDSGENIRSAKADTEDNLRSADPSLYLVGESDSGIEFSAITNICDDGYDTVYLTTNGTAQSRYVKFDKVYGDSEEAVRYYAFLSLDEILGENDSDGYIIAAAIPRDGGKTAVSPIYRLENN